MCVLQVWSPGRRGVRSSKHAVVCSIWPIYWASTSPYCCRSAPCGSVTLVFLHSSSSSSSAFAHSLSLPLSLSEFGFKHDISINYNSLSLNLSGLKSRANDGVAKTCVLSCVQQGATPLGVTVQKPVRRERASCSVKLFPGEFLVSGCILSLTEKSIKFIL